MPLYHYFQRATVFFTATLLMTAASAGRDKSKDTLPAYVLQARTVAILIDPLAGIDVRDPQANRTAQRDVETAMINWGRFQTTMNDREADLLVVVRRGNGRIANATIADPGQNRRPGVIEPTDSGIFIGAQRGNPVGSPSSPTDASEGGAGSGPGGSRHQGAGTQMEVGPTEDSLVVYRGNVENPLDAPAAWRFMQHDALRGPAVPAVVAFRKAVAQAEKAQSNHP